LTGNNHKKAIHRRRMREKCLRFESILNAAKKVFFAKGYSRATMDDIALEAEISKPTIYQYVKSKDDLFFSLMLPVIEEIGNQFETIKDHLARRRYTSGSRLIGDMFNGLQKSYDMAPDVFRIIQLFQQTGLVQELNPQIRNSLNEKGAFNFKTARQIIAMGIEQELIRATNPFEYVDVFWGMFVGIIQLEDIKSQSMPQKRFLKPTLELAEKILIDAMALEND
jgi:TetR/AcrR family transcriptional regulator, fatty acid metabolism regulator protein